MERMIKEQIFALEMDALTNRLQRLQLDNKIVKVEIIVEFFNYSSFFFTALLTITHVTYNKLTNQEEMKYMCKMI